MKSSWSPIIIREIEGDGDGLLYPIPSPSTNGIQTDHLDGPKISTHRANSVHVFKHVQGERSLILGASEINLAIYVTDARVAFACSKYDKGSRWTGGPVSLALNAASMAAAATRRRGKSLVGHIRYPWLLQAGYAERMRGWVRSPESLRFWCIDRQDGENIQFEIRLTLPNSMSSKQLARDVVARAARFRDTCTDHDDEEETTAIKELLEPPELHPPKNEFAVWAFKSAFYPRASTALGDLHPGS